MSYLPLKSSLLEAISFYLSTVLNISESFNCQLSWASLASLSNIEGVRCCGIRHHLRVSIGMCRTSDSHVDVLRGR